MKQLTDRLKEFVPFNETELNLVSTHFFYKKLKKNEYFIKEGEVNNYVAFLLKGMFKNYTLNASGEEIIYYFNRKNDIFSSYSSFITKEPSKVNIQALEDCQLYLISRHSIDELTLTMPKITILRRLLAEISFLEMEKKMSFLHCKTAAEKYKQVLEDSSFNFKGLSQKYLAAYLGISPQHLSRLKK